MVCFGKALGNGLPISAITGTSEYMKIFEKIWVSSTNNMENLSIAGTIATINEIISKNTVQHCWDVGTQFFEGWNKITEENGINAKISGYPVRMALKCYNSKNEESIAMKSLLVQELLKKGVFISPLGPIYMSYSHSKDDIKNSLEKVNEVCKILKSVQNDDYEKYVEGNIPKPIWTMKIPPTRKP